MPDHKHLQLIKITEDMESTQASVLSIMSFGFEMQKLMQEKGIDWKNWHKQEHQGIIYEDAFKSWFSTAILNKEYVKVAVLAAILYHREQYKKD